MSSDDFDPDAFDPDGEAVDLDRETACAYTDYVRGEDVEDLPATGDGATGLERRIWDALYDVEDPEMPVSIVDLGLIYGLELEEVEGADVSTGGTDATANDGDADGSDDGVEPPVHATVLTTLTYTGCPARNMLLEDVESAVESVAGVDRGTVELVWSPEWSLEMVTEEGKADLREFGLSV